MIPYNELKHIPRKPLAEQIPIPAPFAVFLELANYCNLKCPMCPVSNSTVFRQVSGRAQTMSMDVFNRVLEAVPSGIKVLRFYGLGEPLLNRNAYKMIQKASLAGVRTELTTNGLLLNETIKHTELDYLRVSCYDTTPANVLHMVRRLAILKTKHAGFKTHICVKLWDATLHEKVTRYFEGFDVEVVVEDQQHNMGGFLGKGSNQPSVCSVPFMWCAVQPAGHVTPCCVDYGTMRMGNVLYESLPSIWRGEKFKNLRRDLLNRNRQGICVGCDYKVANVADCLDGIPESKECLL